MGEKIDKAKGKIKQAAGKLTGNDKLVREGKRDVIKGEVKGAVSDLREALKSTEK